MRPSSFRFEWLEPRQMLAVDYPTAFEQYLLELINRARANPSAEAARLGIALNEGLAAGTISTTPKQPLAFNVNLIDAAGKHSQWMIDFDTFSHFSGSIGPQQRITASGYSFTGTWTYGENIGWTGSFPNSPNVLSSTLEIHDNLFIDAGVNNRGHRVNMMWDAFREIGAGVVSGTFSSGGTDYNAVMLTTDFATNSGNSAGDSFLTGVAYADLVSANSFYSPGEGLSGVTITAVRAGDNATFTTTSWASGGYSMRLQPGTYTVTATGGGINNPIVYTNVVIGSENVKRDFVPTADSTRPTAGSGAFNFSTSPLKITVQFSESVEASLASGDLQLRALGSTTNIPVTFDSYDGATNTATFTINSIPVDGNYRATILAGSVSDLAGNTNSSAYSFDFYILKGDASRNRIVDSIDFSMLAKHLGESGASFEDGDFNYDGQVNASDSSILIAQFGQRVIAGATTSARPASAPSGAPMSFGQAPIVDLLDQNVVDDLSTPIL